MVTVAVTAVVTVGMEGEVSNLNRDYISPGLTFATDGGGWGGGGDDGGGDYGGDGGGDGGGDFGGGDGGMQHHHQISTES